MMPMLFPAEVLTSDHRYLKARVRQVNETVYVEDTHGKTLVTIGVADATPRLVDGWWQFGDDIVFKARANGRCGCGGTQVL